MSRTNRSSKGVGYDYMSKRPGNKGGCNCPGKEVKRITIGKERAAERRLVFKEMKEYEST